MSKTYFTSKVEPADAALRLGRLDAEPELATKSRPEVEESARSGDLRPVQVVQTSEPGASAKTRLTKRETAPGARSGDLCPV